MYEITFIRDSSELSDKIENYLKLKYSKFLTEDSIINLGEHPYFDAGNMPVPAILSSENPYYGEEGFSMFKRRLLEEFLN